MGAATSGTLHRAEPHCGGGSNSNGCKGERRAAQGGTAATAACRRHKARDPQGDGGGSGGTREEEGGAGVGLELKEGMDGWIKLVVRISNTEG